MPPAGTLEWRPDGRHAKRAGPWLVAGCRVCGHWRFVLTHDARTRDMGFRHPVHEAWYFDSGEAARAAAQDMEGGGNGNL